MIRAAGILFVSPAGRVLLMRRAPGGTDHGGEWAFPGGGIEDGETAEVAARREMIEETGVEYARPLSVWTRRIKDGVDFTTFIAKAEEFEPALNPEHDLYLWLERDTALAEPATDVILHPGARIALRRFEMDETQVAQAIRDEDLVSPQRIGSSTLIGMRVTGTGMVYRKGRNEYAWRDPSHYLNDHFLDRCNGLPVIWQHPKLGLTQLGKDEATEEYRQRNVGSLAQAWIKGDEVWAIARIMDAECADLLDAKQLSTSPGVVFTDYDENTRIPMGDAPFLIEGKPSVLDHLAICPLGVWDRGGPPAGISNQSLKEPVMPESTLDAAAVGKIVKDSMEGVMDAVKKHVSECMDSVRAECNSRMDAAEKERKDEKERMNKERLDAVQRTRLDAETAAAATAAATTQAAKDAELQALKDQNAALSARMDSLTAHVADAQSEDRAKFAAVWERGEQLAQFFGDSAGCPRWAPGETLAAYSRRVFGKYKAHSPRWKDVDLANIADEAAFTVAATDIYNDAEAASKRATDLPKGQLRQIETVDKYSGQRKIKFVGDDAGSTWEPFMNPLKVGKLATPDKAA